jgi:hypothetical protein
LQVIRPPSLEYECMGVISVSVSRKGLRTFRE